MLLLAVEDLWSDAPPYVRRRSLWEKRLLRHHPTIRSSIFAMSKGCQNGNSDLGEDSHDLLSLSFAHAEVIFGCSLRALPRPTVSSTETGGARGTSCEHRSLSEERKQSTANPSSTCHTSPHVVKLGLKW